MVASRTPDDRRTRLDVVPNRYHSGTMPAQASDRKDRHRLTADVPEAVDARVRQTARDLYRGVVSDAVAAALEALQWMIEAKSRGMRVVATDADSLPAAYEEPRIPGLGALGHEWTWLVRRDHPWRRQLWIKGRNIAAGQLARTAAIEHWTPEQAAEEYDLPVAAVVEAFRYSATARDLIAAEEAENRIAATRYERPSAAVSR